MGCLAWLTLLPALLPGGACGRQGAPRTPPAAGPEASRAAIDLRINGLSPSQEELHALLASAATEQERRERLTGLVDEVLLWQLAQGLEHYRKLAGLPGASRRSLVERFLADHFAPERYCAALPEGDLRLQFRRTRPRYDHPDYWVLASFRARCCALDGAAPCQGCAEAPELIAARLEESLASGGRLGDEERTDPNDAPGLARWWSALVAPLGLHGEVQRWTLFDDPRRPGAFKPGLRIPGAWREVLSLVEGQGSVLIVGEEAIHLWIALETIPARRGSLADDDIRADIRRDVCRERVSAGKQQLLEDLRATAIIEGLPGPGP